MTEVPEKPDKLESREVLERRKLDLEVKELEQKIKPTIWGTIGRLVPVIAPSFTILGLIIGAVFTYKNEDEKHRLESQSSKSPSANKLEGFLSILCTSI